MTLKYLLRRLLGRYHSLCSLATSHAYHKLRLSPEALEEFLSILQPVIMKNPDSPIIRPRYDRPYSWNHKRNRSSSSDEYRSISEQSLHSKSGEELDQVSDEIKYDHRHWHYSSVLCALFFPSDTMYQSS